MPQEMKNNRKMLTGFFSVVLLVLIALFGIYLYLRFALSWSRSVLFATAAIGGIFIALETENRVQDLKKSLRKFGWKAWPTLLFEWFFDWLVGSVIGAAAVVFTTAGYTASLFHLYEVLQDPEINRSILLWSAIPLTLTIGAALFFIRLKFRCLYGSTEVIVGVAVGYFQVAKVNSNIPLDESFFVPFLTAAIYLVVRGLDNMHAGLKASNPDFVARRLLRSRWIHP